METITVIAMSGCTCPRERAGEPAITDSEPVTVKRTPFYTRLIADGSLRIHQEQKPTRKNQDKTEKSGGNK